jgi:hypothetical protein
MKRKLICILIYSLCVRPAMTEEQPRPAAGDQSVGRVSTAIDHLTVLEYDEPVTMAAAGSSAFQIERQVNKVFIKPLRSGATTNLFVWTASNHGYSYELLVGDVANMNAVIHNATPKAQPAPDGRAMEQMADVLVRRTLLGVHEINSTAIKDHPRNKVQLRIERVFPGRTSLYIQYSIENRTGKPYRVTTPSVTLLQPEKSHINPLSLRSQQIDRQVIDELGRAKEVPLTVAHAESQIDPVMPGGRQQGIVAVGLSEEMILPVVLQVAFDSDVKGIFVF